MLEKQSGNVVILWFVEVKESYQHKGVATKLLEKLYKDMEKNFDKEVLLFYNKNSTLTEFYQKQGFLIGDNLMIAEKAIVLSHEDGV